MKRIAAITLAIILTVLLGGFVFIYSGVYNVAAKDAHWPITAWMIEKIRDRSIAAHAASIAVPATLNDEAMIVDGADHFATHCAVCHGGPGIERDDIAEGMYPQPPDLDHVSQHFTAAELFWILKNGIKMTGMPSWADHSDDELWNIVAFLEKLPGMPPDEYKRLIAAARAQPGHHHTEGMDMDNMGHDDHAPRESGDRDHEHGGESAPATQPPPHGH